MDTIRFKLNGKDTATNCQPPSLMLVDYIRNHVGLTGTKVGCGEGGCGSCVVNISYVQNGDLVNKSITSCLTPLHSVAGASITTIEGIGGEKSGKFHPIQERLAEKHGSQCGYCSPGMCMTMYSYLNNSKKPTVEEAELQLDGNLCRCTGYRPILDTIKSFCNTEVDIEDLGRNNTCKLDDRKSFHVEYNDQHYYRVSSLQEYDKIKNSGLKNIKLIAGATSRGIYKDEFDHQVLVDINPIPELHEITYLEKGVKFGAGISINKWMELLKDLEAKQKYHQQYYSQIILHITKIAGTPVRNNATMGGNIALLVVRPDFPSDVVPILAAMQAKVTIYNNTKLEEIPIENISSKLGDSLVLSVYIPFPVSNEHFLSYKVAIRHQNAHAYVNHCFRFVLNEKNNTITDSSVVFGAVMQGKLKFENVETLLKGKHLTPELLEEAVKLVHQEIKPTESEGHAEYKKQLCTNLLYKSLLKVYSLGNQLDKKLLSAVNSFERPISSGTQSYGEIDDEEKPLGHIVPKIEAKTQASGEATYSDDVAAKNRLTLFGAYVVSSIAAGKIKSIDISEAQAFEGFVDWVTHKDVPATNSYPGFFGDTETVFAEEEIQYQGQMIGVVVGTSRLAAQEAAKRVKIEYDTAGFEPITNIKEGIARKSFWKSKAQLPSEIKRGDVEKTFSDPSLEIIEGELDFGSQYAFYMEPQVSYADIGDNKTIIVHASVQDLGYPQETIALTLGVPKNKVEVIAKRVGGAFGSKYTQSTRTAASAAICANKLGSPVSICLDRHTDMITIGKRHPMFAKYKVSVEKKTGKIAGIQMDLFIDSGYGCDFSPFVLFMAETHLESCYFIENCNIQGHMVKTNLPNNTAVRTFGGIQAYYCMETINNHIAHQLNIPLLSVQEVNFFKSGQTTTLGAPIVEPDYTLPYVWPECVTNSLYVERVKNVDKFNSENRWRKRGISIMPMRFATSFGEAKHGAELHVYSDGSVVVGTSGIDMGQGLNTKVAQTVAHYLDIPLEHVNFVPTDNFHIPNASFTAGSIGSHSSMVAAKAACDIIQERLAPFKKEKPNASWKELCKFAVESGAHLSVAGWMVRGKIIENNKPLTPSDVPQDPFAPTPLDYNSYGVSVTEVEIDVLTGEVQVLDAYVYYDTGKSANPAIDLGQVEGGFIMGLGNMLTEQITTSEDGIQLNDSTWTYKIPCSLDIPIKSSMNLFSKNAYQRGMLRSKAASEGPMCLSVSSFFAVRNAVESARKESGISGWYRFDPPALPHNIFAHTETKLAHLKIHSEAPPPES